MNDSRLSAGLVVALVVASVAAGGVGAQSAEEDDLFATLEGMVPTYIENADGAISGR